MPKLLALHITSCALKRGRDVCRDYAGRAGGSTTLAARKGAARSRIVSPPRGHLQGFRAYVSPGATSVPRLTRRRQLLAATAPFLESKHRACWSSTPKAIIHHARSLRAVLLYSVRALGPRPPRLCFQLLQRCGLPTDIRAFCLGETQQPQPFPVSSHAAGTSAARRHSDLTPGGGVRGEPHCAGYIPRRVLVSSERALQ